MRAFSIFSHVCAAERRSIHSDPACRTRRTTLRIFPTEAESRCAVDGDNGAVNYAASPAGTDADVKPSASNVEKKDVQVRAGGSPAGAGPANASVSIGLLLVALVALSTRGRPRRCQS